MGFIAHDAAVAVASGQPEKLEALTEAVAQWRAGLPDEWQPLVLGPVAAPVNGYLTWVFAPDGSKSGWDTDEDGARYREQFARLFDGQYASVVEVQFGADLRGEDPNVTARYIDDHRDDDDD